MANDTDSSGGTDVFEASSYLSNWGSGSFWDRVRGSKLPTPNIGKLLKTAAGGLALTVGYGYAETARRGGIWLSSLARGLPSFYGDLTSALTGGPEFWFRRSVDVAVRDLSGVEGFVVALVVVFGLALAGFLAYRFLTGVTGL